MVDISADRARVHAQPLGETRESMDTACLKDFQECEHPGSRTTHTDKFVLDTGRFLSSIRFTVCVMTAHDPRGLALHFASIRIITDDVDRIATFYEQATGQTAKRSTDDFAEIITTTGTVALASARTVRGLGAQAPRPAANQSVIIEFRVDDVDLEYENLKQFDIAFVTEPTTQPWGNRSLLFRDPDGNLVNFFTPVTPDALKRYER
jgi:predicted enzyme related to lactoylglutathione lyase